MLQNLFSSYTNQRYSSLFLFLIACTVALATLFFYLHFNEYYGNTIADPAYYYAQGQSLHQYGELRDITVSPHQPPLNAHMAIGLLHYVYASVWDNPVTVFRATPWIGLFLFLASWFPLQYIGRYHFNLSNTSIAVVFLFLAASPVYMHFSLIAARTEAWFFPLVLCWSALFFKWYKTDRPTSILLLILLLVLSFSLYMFRIQGAIVLLAGILTLAWDQQWQKVGILTTIAAISIGGVLWLNYQLSGVIMGEGETGHLSNALEITTERLVAFIPAIGQFFFNFEHTTVSMLIGVTGIPLLIGYGINVLFHQEYTVRFAGLLTLGSLAALFLFRTEEDTIQLRYIYYVMPVFLFSICKIDKEISVITNKLPAHYILTGIIILHLLLFGYRNLWNYQHQMELLSQSKDRYEQLSELYQEYQPTQICHSGSKESERLWFIITGKGVVPKESEQCTENSFRVVDSYNGDDELLADYMIHDRYYIYKIINNIFHN